MGAYFSTNLKRRVFQDVPVQPILSMIGSVQHQLANSSKCIYGTLSPLSSSLKLQIWIPPPRLFAVLKF